MGYQLLATSHFAPAMFLATKNSTSLLSLIL